MTLANLTPRSRLSSSALRALAGIAIVASLASCATRQEVSAPVEAANYAAHARRNYTPPGPPSDPWGPYIMEASAKYDMPDKWIRAVIRAESSGQMYEKGTLITSDAGAMGLMQVMPRTFDELRARYSLGDDPYDPHDNIMAGTAYLREMFDVYGSPGFLAAYNAGPGKLDDYLNHNKPLPLETRNYVAKIGPSVQDTFPQRPSAAGELAMNQLPFYIPAGPRYARATRYAAPVALAENRMIRNTGRTHEAIQYAALPEPPRYSHFSRDAREGRPLLYASNATPAHSGFHLIPRAVAETVPLRRGGPANGNWAIQVGAFGNENLARAAATSARGQSRELATAQPTVGAVHQSRATLYRARLTGLSRESAIQACGRLSHGRGTCMVISPGSQS
jgi:hypothetical protein